MEEISVENGVFEAVSHRKGKRGRNWTAVLSGQNFANVNRKFLQRSGDAVSLGNLTVGDALEFGSDHVSGGGVRYGNRCYCVVRALTPTTLTVEWYDTGAQAMRNRPAAVPVESV